MIDTFRLGHDIYLSAVIWKSKVLSGHVIPEKWSETELYPGPRESIVRFYVTFMHFLFCWVPALAIASAGMTISVIFP